MKIEKLILNFLKRQDFPAIFYNENECSYASLHQKVLQYDRFILNKLRPGAVVIFYCSDYSINSVALFLALLAKKMIVAILSPDNSNLEKHEEMLLSESRITLDEEGEPIFSHVGDRRCHPLYDKLRSANSAGLILMSSGSTGQPKAILHDFDLFMGNMKKKNKIYRTIPFLRFNHIGGVNTLLQTLLEGGSIIIPPSKSPIDLLYSISNYHAEALVTTPSYLNMLLLSGEFNNYNLSSLKHISYGGEVMTETFLRRIRSVFPGVKLSQGYGLTELGVLKIKSQSSSSGWFKIDMLKDNIRIRKGLLEIKTNVSMLGYIGIDSPIYTDDGWFMTGDRAIYKKNGYIKILGRNSDVINVGGEKVYPSEIENELMKHELVKDIVIVGEKNNIIGNIVCAKVILNKTNLSESLAKTNIREYCLERFPIWMVPQKIVFLDRFNINNTGKKERIN